MLSFHYLQICMSFRLIGLPWVVPESAPVPLNRFVLSDPIALVSEGQPDHVDFNMVCLIQSLSTGSLFLSQSLSTGSYCLTQSLSTGSVCLPSPSQQGRFFYPNPSQQGLCVCPSPPEQSLCVWPSPSQQGRCMLPQSLWTESVCVGPTWYVPPFPNRIDFFMQRWHISCDIYVNSGWGFWVKGILLYSNPI